MNATTLFTKNAVINGKNVVVEQLLGTANRQDIFYKVDGKRFLADKFWKLKPTFVD